MTASDQTIIAEGKLQEPASQIWVMGKCRITEGKPGSDDVV